MTYCYEQLKIVVLLFNLASKSVEFVFLRIGLMLSQLYHLFFKRSCERWGWHIMKVHGSKRWGFNHHWNPDLGTETRMPGSPRKNSWWICNISTIFFLLCMEYNYILKTIVGASSLRGITGEKKASCLHHPMKTWHRFSRSFSSFPWSQVLDPFPQLIFTPPQEGRLVGSDFFAVNLVGRMKGQGKGMNNLFFSSFGCKKVSLQ